MKFDETKYEELLEEIYQKFPSFQVVGDRALKLGLENMQTLDSALGNPSQVLKCVHIAGTNGKGSVSSMIASALMECRLKVGLYTSPHLVDFRERIKINGGMISREWVYDFLVEHKELFEKIGASFFEITTAMAFSYFAQQKVDIAVIECGLGGRLDSTNILTPLVCVITNIGLDHCQYLGNTLDSIAREKAGIIKSGVPVVIGQRLSGDEPFVTISKSCGSEIYFAEDIDDLKIDAAGIAGRIKVQKMDLKGEYQNKNIKTAATALAVLTKTGPFAQLLEQQNVSSNKTFRKFVKGIQNAAHNTHLRGRWEILSKKPLVICDIGHNEHGMKETIPQVIATADKRKKKSEFYMLFGVMKDKDLKAELPLLPQKAHYLWVKAASERALPALELAEIMRKAGFNGEVVEDGDIKETLKWILQKADPQDFIFIGGSSYVVAEALRYFDENPFEK